MTLDYAYTKARRASALWRARNRITPQTYLRIFSLSGRNARRSRLSLRTINSCHQKRLGLDSGLNPTPAHKPPSVPSELRAGERGAKDMRAWGWSAREKKEHSSPSCFPVSAAFLAMMMASPFNVLYMCMYSSCYITNKNVWIFLKNYIIVLVGSTMNPNGLEYGTVIINAV